MATEVERRLGAQVARYRKAARLTQEQLANKLRIAHETVSRLERGHSMVSLKRLEQIAQVLGVRLRDLFDFQESPLPPKRPSAKEREIQALLRELNTREQEDVALVRNVARQFFKHLPKRARRKR